MRALNFFNGTGERHVSTEGAILAMVPKTRMKRKAEAAGIASAESRKKQRASLDSAESLATQSELSPTASVSLSAHEAPAIVTVSPAGNTSSVGDVELASTPSVSVTDSASVAGPSSRIVEECTSVTDITSEVTESAASDVLQPSISEPQKQDPHEVLGKFANEWLEALDRDDTKGLALFLSCQLVHRFSFTETNAAEYAAAMVKKSDGTVRRWRSDDGILPESQQGRYQRSGVLWKNEEVNKKATEHVRQNACSQRKTKSHKC